MTDTARRITHSAFWLIAGQLANRALNFVAVAYAARVLGAEPFGAFAFAFAFVTIAFTFSDLGVNLLVGREYGRSADAERRGLLAALWYVKFCCIIGSAFLALALFAVLPTPIPIGLFWLVLAIVATDLVRDFFTAVARSVERGILEGIVLIVDGLLTAMLGTLFLYATGTVEGLAAGYALAGLCACLLSISLVRRYGVPLFTRPDWRRMRTLLRTIWPFAGAAIMAVSFVQVDVLLLGWLRGATEVGLYAPGSRIVQILLVLATLIGGAVLPALSRATGSEREALMRRMFTGFLALALPLTIGGIVLAQPLLVLLYGPAFAGGSGSFALLLIMFLAYGCAMLLDHLLLAANLQNRNFQLMAIAAAANVVLALVLIPRWGILGAAGASLGAQVLNLALTAYLARRTLSIRFMPWRDAGSYALAALVMGVLVTWSGLPVLVALPVGGIAYLAILVLVRPPLLREGLRLIRS